MEAAESNSCGWEAGQEGAEWNKADELYEYVIQESLLAWVYNTGSVGGDDMKKFNPRRD